MTIPLIVLGALSIVGGLMGIPEALHGSHMLKQFLAPVFAASDLRILPHVISHETEYMLMGIAVLTIVILIFVARAKYVKNAEVPVPEGEKLSALHKLLYNKYYVDELYDTLFVKPIAWLSKQFHNIVELKFIDSIVNSLGNLVVWCGSTLRLAQTGNIGVYLLIMVLSAILILFINTLL
jgi:NADH-quinone oxidoreductase subunit L